MTHVGMPLCSYMLPAPIAPVAIHLALYVYMYVLVLAMYIKCVHIICT